MIPQNYGYLWDAVALGAFVALQGGLHLAWGFGPHQWEWATVRRPGERAASHYARTVEHTLGDASRLLDVMPTILELAGLGRCGDCSGDSLTRLFGRGAAPPRRALLLRDNDQVGLILDGWKLLFAPRYGVLELYLLGDERPEAELSRQHPDVAGEMLGLLRISPLRHLPPLRVR